MRLNSKGLSISPVFIKIEIIALLIFLCPIKSQAQDLLVTSFIDNENFQNVEFYNFLEDKRGFLWIGSNHGVFRYDGTHLVNYQKKDSTSFDDVLNILEDKTGRVWLVTFREGLIYYDYKKRRIVIPSWNDNLKKSLKGSWVSNLFVAADSSLWLQKFGFIQDTSSSFFQIKNDSIYQYELTANSDIDSFVENFNFSPKEKQFFRRIHQGLVDKIPLWDIKTSSLKHLFEEVNQKSIISYNFLFPLKKRQDPNHIIRKIIEIEPNVFLALTYNGFIKFPYSNSPIHYLSEYQINDVYRLSNGKYLFSTAYNGILVSSSMDVKKYSFEKKEEKVAAVHINQDKVYIKTKKSIYRKSTLDKQPALLLSIDKKYRNINLPNRFLVWNNKVIINNIAFFDGKNQRYLFSKENQKILRGRSKSIQVIQDSLLLVTTAKGFVTLNKKREIVTNSQTLGYKTWTYTGHLVEDKKIWLGTIDGVVEYDYEKKDFKRITLPISFAKIKEIKGKKDAMIFIGSQKEGLLIYTASQQIFRVNEKDGLNSNYINKILLEDDTTAWVGTSDGINRVVFSPTSLDVNVSSYLSGFFINDLELLGDTIFAVANEKLISFPLQIKPLRTNSPSIVITELTINGKKRDLNEEEIKLKRNENNIRISYAMPDFTKHKTADFYYAIVLNNSTDTIWNQTTDFSISYLLNPGDYSLLLRTADPSSVKKIHIYIESKFIDTIYFDLLIFLLIILGVSTIAFVVVKIIKQRVELKKELVDSELKLLRSQMNPHFLFNTLSSISGHITMNNIWQATIYLSSFAQLVRNVLESSKHSFLPLKEELQILQDYIKLEKMRLGDNYIISIAVENEDFLNSFYMPPMLIQPFIENSIIHGVNPNGGGNISIVFKRFTADILEIIIQDDGVGRVASSKDTEMSDFLSKTSMGISNVYERLSIINKTYKINIELKIEDLYGSQGEATGTKVQILLPMFDYIVD